MGTLLSWLSKLGPQSVELLMQALAIVKQIQQAEDLAEQIKKSLLLIQLVASITPTEVDDNILRYVNQLISDELIDRLAAMVEQFLGSSVSTMSTEQYREEADFFEAQGINFLQLIAIAKMVADLIAQLRKAQTI